MSNPQSPRADRFALHRNRAARSRSFAWVRGSEFLPCSWSLLRRVHQACEAVEQVETVRGAGRGFGVVLDGEDRAAVQCQASVGAVEQ